MFVGIPIRQLYYCVVTKLLILFVTSLLIFLINRYFICFQNWYSFICENFSKLLHSSTVKISVFPFWKSWDFVRELRFEQRSHWFYRGTGTKCFQTEISVPPRKIALEECFCHFPHENSPEIFLNTIFRENTWKRVNFSIPFYAKACVSKLEFLESARRDSQRNLISDCRVIAQPKKICDCIRKLALMTLFRLVLARKP